MLSTLQINDVVNVPIIAILSPEFGNLAITTLQTKGGFIDVLMNPEGELIKQDQYPEAVKAISEGFNKQFKPVMFDDKPTWGHYLT